MVRSVIRLARPWIGEPERAATAEALESGMLVQGARVVAFEQALAERCGRTHAVACSSGTAALELALAALEVHEGDVLCPDLSWPSPAHAIVRAGARPVLVDVDPSHWNVKAEALAAARTAETRAAIAIDQFGMPADHDAIARALPGVPLIVDAACSLGSTLHGRPAPAGGVVSCLSFHPRKVITTGEGGACLTDDARLAERLRVLRNHGQREAGRFVAAAGNHRLGEVAAALGLAQLARLDAIVDRRRALARRYRDALPSRLRPSVEPPGACSNAQTFGLALPPGASAADRDALVVRLREAGVESGRLSYALHALESLRGHGGGPFPVAEHLDRCGLALPLHPLLTDAEQDRVIEAVHGACEAMEVGA